MKMTHQLQKNWQRKYVDTSNKKIALTGGGTAGHVTPNIALAEELKNRNFDIIYIGTNEGMEKGIVIKYNIPFFSISSGKLRRYFSIENFKTPFYVLKGVFDAIKILKEQKVNIVFSKGGYVTVPVVIAAHFLKIPIISHEADFTPGLANKINIPFSDIICTNFKETTKMIKRHKAIYTGCPIRKKLLIGNKDKAKSYFKFKEDKPILLIIGGSLGSLNLNSMIRENLHELMSKFNIIHSCGKGKIDYNYQENNKEYTIYKYDAYRQYELLTDDLSDIYAYSDLIVARAGANVIFEILALKKPNLLIPLGLKASRGDQILNAKSFKKQGYSDYLLEEEYEKDKSLFIKKINDIMINKKTYIFSMMNSEAFDSSKKIVDIIEKTLQERNNQNV